MLKQETKVATDLTMRGKLSDSLGQWKRIITSRVGRFGLTVEKRGLADQLLPPNHAIILKQSYLNVNFIFTWYQGEKRSVQEKCNMQ